MKAFITDGDQRPALAITRSLGRRGVSVLVGSDQPASLASESKYCIGHVTYPSPYQHPEAFERFMVDFVRRERVAVVLPVTDVTTHLVTRNAAAINEYSSVAAPPFEAFDFVANKMRLLRRAEQCGIPIPRTHFLEHGSELRPLLSRIEYPAVIKPVRSRIPTSTGWLPATVQYARNEADLVRAYRETDYLFEYPSLIQERIVGPGIGVFVLCDHGRLRASFAHRRLREKPPSGGASVLSESVPLDRELVDFAMRLLGPLGWHGVAMMEFKQDRHTGQAFLMEVNGRFWGSLHLAVQAGVDFPYLNYQLAVGERFADPRPYRVGVRSRWLLGDLDHLLVRLFHSADAQQLPAGSPSRLGALCNFFELTGARLHYDVISRDDPRPFVHEAQRYAKDLSASVFNMARRLVSFSRRPVVYPALASHHKQESRHAGTFK